ncbi:glycoside hydrolase family protein [Pluralibacter gergoviae]|nr:glycoside hydrolase family protein [Pluralibacter gergoviae]ELD4303994.1 glycoside hydrolase family protein [Pluralibacter gergoviae]
MDIKERLWKYEGDQQYQTFKGYFRQGKFFPYQDSLGYLTVGAGHLVQNGEDFSDGLTPIEADLLLAKDIEIAKSGLKSLDLGRIPQDWQDFLIIMIFQLGLQGVRNFRKMIEAIKVKDWPEAVRQARDSKWYKQTPNRVNDMIYQLKNR